MRRIGCIPVVDDAGILARFITETDCLAAILEFLDYRELDTRIVFEVPDRPDDCQQIEATCGKDVSIETS